MATLPAEISDTRSNASHSNDVGFGFDAEKQIEDLKAEVALLRATQSTFATRVIASEEQRKSDNDANIERVKMLAAQKQKLESDLKEAQQKIAASVAAAEEAQRIANVEAEAKKMLQAQIEAKQIQDAMEAKAKAEADYQAEIARQQKEAEATRLEKARQEAEAKRQQEEVREKRISDFFAHPIGGFAKGRMEYAKTFGTTIDPDPGNTSHADNVHRINLEAAEAQNRHMQQQFAAHTAAAQAKRNVR